MVQYSNTRNHSGRLTNKKTPYSKKTRFLVHSKFRPRRRPEPSECHIAVDFSLMVKDRVSRQYSEGTLLRYPDQVPLPCRPKTTSVVVTILISFFFFRDLIPSIVLVSRRINLP